MKTAKNLPTLVVIWISIGALFLSSCGSNSSKTSSDLAQFRLSNPAPNFTQHSADFLQSLSSQVTSIRVLIFPHAGKYTAPQGKETQADQVTLSSTQGCRAVLDDNSATLLQTGNVLSFAANRLRNRVRVACNGPATLIRESGLKSYQYEGSLVIIPGTGSDGNRNLKVVNILPFDSYIKGVVPSEMPSDWPLAALKVQAVAARTYALFEVQNSRAQNPDADYDLDDTVAYQAYLGLTNSSTNSNAAVDSTAGQIITYQHQIIKAYFFDDSGGYTEDADHVWPGSLPYCKAKQELYSQSQIKTWNKVIPLSTITEKLAAVGLVSHSNPVRSLKVLDSERYPSGRASLAHLILSDGSSKEVLATDLRYQLGLRSTLFSVVSETGADGKAEYRFEGQGYGHGVGMSQLGAKLLAEDSGWNYLKILSFYYTDVEMCTFSPDQASAQIPSCSFSISR